MSQKIKKIPEVTWNSEFSAFKEFFRCFASKYTKKVISSLYAKRSKSESLYHAAGRLSKWELANKVNEFS